MCSLTLALGLLSTGIGAIGQVQQAQATASANKQNAQIAEMNAKLADRRARDALERGKENEQQQRVKAARLMGQQQVAMAANGVDLTFGSPLDTLVDTATMAELDALTIRKNAANEAYDYKVDGVNKRAQASMYRSAASSALTGGYLGAVGSVITGGANAYRGYQSARIG